MAGMSQIQPSKERQLQASFAAGEISPNLYARVDLAKYKIGAATLRNFFVDFRGGASNRQGTEFIFWCGTVPQFEEKSGVNTYFYIGFPRIIPFVVSEQDGYVLEFGYYTPFGSYFRIYQFGVPQLEAPQAITAATNANPGIFTVPFHGFVTGDWISISGETSMTEINTTWVATVIDANTFLLSYVPFEVGTPSLDTTTFPTYAGNGVAQRVVTVAIPYAMADFQDLKFAQSGKVMTICHPSYPPGQIILSSSGTWSYSVIYTGPTQAPPGTLTLYPPSTTDPDYCYSYVVTAVSADGKSESLPCDPKLAHYTILDETVGFVIPMTWVPSTDPVSVYRIYKCGPFDDRTSTGPGSIWGYIGSSQTATFTDLNIAPDFTQTPPLFGDPFSGGQIEGINVAGGGSGYPSGGSWTGYISLSISDAQGSGAAGFLTTNHSGVGTGVFLTAPGRNYVNPTITAGAGGATFTTTLGSYTPTYPAVPGYFQQRQVFGGANSTPTTLVMSRIGDYLNFNTTPIVVDTDALVDEIVSGEVNTIKAMINVSYGLLVFTSGGLYLVNGGGTSAALTPESITDTAQASNGANDLPPIRINYSILYVQNRGNIVRDCSFAWQRQSYTGTDISTLSNHLFFNYTLQQWWWNEEPYKQVGVIRDDGIMLNLTYVPDQEIYAWSHYDTNGYFRSGCSVPEGNYNVVYVICQRLINNNWVYYLERFDNRVFDYIEDAWFLDCAGTIPLVNYTTILKIDGACADAGVIEASAVSGTGVTLTAVSRMRLFYYAEVGDIFWALGGKAVITSVISTNKVIVTVLKPFPPIPNTIDAENPEGIPVLFYGDNNDWAYGATFTEVTGLNYLEGMNVSALADGMPVENLTVTNGTVTLPNAASKIVVGLPYQSQLKTLRVELDGAPTMQGRRKTIPAATLILDKSLGLKAGQSFQYLDVVHDIPSPYSVPNEMFSGELYLPLTGEWDINGQVCIQCDHPLPCTVLGIVPEVLVGDTQR